MCARRAAPAAGRDNDLVAQPHAHPEAHCRHHSACNPVRPPACPPFRAWAAPETHVHARTGTRTHLRTRAHAQHWRDRAGRETRAARWTLAKWDRRGGLWPSGIGQGRSDGLRGIARSDSRSGTPGRVAGIVRVSRCCAVFPRPPTSPPLTIADHKRAILAGLVEFLISDDPLACALRARLIFKVPSRRLTSPPFLVSCGFGHDARPPARAA